MYTDDIHKLVMDGLRVEPSLRWGTSRDGKRLGAKATVEIANIETKEVFRLTIERVPQECRNPSRCSEKGICICDTAEVAYR